jgi:hypothetical protein
LWNGKAKDAQISIDRIRAVMHHFQGEQGERKSIAPSRKLWTALHALDGYLTGQSGWIVNYAQRHRAGLRVGTAITEGAANFLVNRRMNKSQHVAGRDKGPISCSKFAARSTMARLVPAMDRDSTQPTIHTRIHKRFPSDPPNLQRSRLRAANPRNSPSNALLGIVPEQRLGP